MRTVSKRTSRREYTIQKKLHAFLPKYVPRALSYKNGRMISEKLGVSLKTWLRRHPNVTNSVLAQIVKNVRLILEKIRRRYPGFRHMDLHIGNVLMCRGRVMLIDFGLSKMNGRRVQVNRDMNTFIKSLRLFLRRKKRKVLKTTKKKEESAADIAKRIAQGR